MAGHTAILLQDGRVLAAAGYGAGAPPDYLASAEIYDPAAGTWSTTGNMSVSRHVHQAVRLADGRVLVAGGYRYGSTSSSEIYNPATGSWTTAGSMNTSRYGHALVLLANGEVLAAGGYSDGGGGYRGWLAEQDLKDRWSWYRDRFVRRHKVRRRKR